eukprot:CAMPEP_0202837446 /NCGR_PEP_ID=MMETSP1389-20130828/45852_1 /ASSEMBLY_ACC=CAM_ASM_000865 /TAXON_ID=302021 /ORGANISM="Rhodomonas sp., Strain CCMP768" /LENGTH=34 /DNA_ID= /DNA_START= /DNA_END= /DNA_ORIENTATION=
MVTATNTPALTKTHWCPFLAPSSAIPQIRGTREE